MELRCYACERALNSAAFAPDGSKASGFKSICRDCDCEKLRRYYAANRERKLAAANERNASPHHPLGVLHRPWQMLDALEVSGGFI